MVGNSLLIVDVMNLGELPIVLLFAIVVLILFSWIYISVSQFNNTKELRVGTIRILSIFFASIFIMVSSLLINLINFVFNYQNAFYENKFWIFSWQTGLIIISLFGIVAILSVFIFRRNSFYKKAHIYMGYPTFSSHRRIKHKNIKHIQKKLPYWALINLIPFLLLIFISTEKKNVVSIFMDNSVSMKKELNVARNTFKDILGEFPDQTTVIFSFFKTRKQVSRTEAKEKEKGFKDDFTEITNNFNYDQLKAGSNLIFNNTYGARHFIESKNFDYSYVGTPLNEVIWKSFLFDLDQLKNSEKDKYKFIITDGEGRLYSDKINQGSKIDKSIYKVPTVTGKNMDSFYEKLVTINLGGEEDSAFFKYVPVDYTVSNLSELAATLEKTMKPFFQRDYDKIYYALGIVLLLFILLLISVSLKPAIKGK